MSQTQQTGHPHMANERDLAYVVLVLERQLEATQRLHEEDIASLRAALQELKVRIVELAQTSMPSGSGSQST
ncbi:MAG: hypothetical protein GXP37_09005 [Chloroflexi bacterium]|nr:hypothetical protein [Chloroflexota bacterium]